MNPILLETLLEAEAFVDRHSEPWYTTGQLLLAKIRDQIKLLEEQNDS